MRNQHVSGKTGLLRAYIALPCCLRIQQTPITNGDVLRRWVKL